MSARAPNSLDTLRQDLIRKELEKQRAKRVNLQSQVPKVNRDLFLKLKSIEMDKKKAKKGGADLLTDDRFKGLFDDDRFQVDTNDEAYRLLNPVVSKLDKDKRKALEEKFSEVQEEEEGDGEVLDSEASDMEGTTDDSSSDDDRDWAKEVKREHKKIQSEKAAAKHEAKLKAREEKYKRFNNSDDVVPDAGRSVKLFELKDGEEFDNLTEKKPKKKKLSKMTLEDRLAGDEVGDVVKTNSGHTMTFKVKKPKSVARKEEEMRKHREERRNIRRSASHLKKDKLPPKFWMGKRVR